MAAGRTYTPIATTTVTSNASTVVFSSIPSGYTDLILTASAQTSGPSGYYGVIQLNSDTGTNYSCTILYGTGSAAGSVRTSNASYIQSAYYGSLPSASQAIFDSEFWHIMNYSNTTTYKSILCRIGSLDSSYGGAATAVGLWRSTSAVTSITFKSTNAYVAPGSTFTLYGIAAA